MNYIRHLNAFFSHVKTDTRLTASHVSLYLALFQYWNFNRFQNPFAVYRENMMQLSKIGSKNTYHKCIKELHQAQYILYHPAVSKYQPVKISMIRLDTKQQATTYKQLDLFSPNNGTTQVPILTDASLNISTPQVPNLGHPIKPNINKQRETPTHEISKRNKKIQAAVNDIGRVSNSGHTGSCHHEHKQEISKAYSKLATEGQGTQTQQPEHTTVEEVFKQKNYPITEATKFYNHYKALGWKIQGKTPIQDWKPLVEKWMANATKWNDNKQQQPVPATTEINYLYESFLEGKKIFHQITAAHFDQLKLQLDDEVMKQAGQERINQVTGTNQHSLIELWKAYLTNDPAHPLIQKDKPNLIDLAKRLAVLNHFHKLKNQSQ